MKTIERIKQFIDYKGISLNAFDNKIFSAGGYIGKQIKANASVGSDVLEKILCAFPEINPAWLITGVGNMLMQPNSASYQENILQPSNHAAENTASYGNKPDLRKLYAQEMDLHKQLFALQQQLHEVRMSILGAEAAAVR